MKLHTNLTAHIRFHNDKIRVWKTDEEDVIVEDNEVDIGTIVSVDWTCLHTVHESITDDMMTKHCTTCGAEVKRLCK